MNSPSGKQHKIIEPVPLDKGHIFCRRIDPIVVIAKSNKKCKE